MSFRVFKGNVLSAQGWRMCNADECVWMYIPGTNNSVSIQVRSGIPAVILPAFLARFNQLVEKLRDADTACWTLNNDVDTSNHPAGVATDANWGLHPFHARGTFGDRLPILRQVLNEFRGCVDWGGDWRSPIDEMHFELAHPEGYLDRNGNFVLAVDQRLIDLANDLKAGYLGIYSANESGSVLSQAMGATAGVDYAALQPAVTQCLLECDCTTVDRIAMWMAQVGHESAGLKYMEEIASGAAYEGRADLGNTQPGDGVRFKGRGPIQVTGRDNYTELSQWAFDQGLVPSASFFVDQPAQLASTRYGFIGVTWYWTTQRPMNDAADAKDLVRATQYVNGGQNGIDDRRNRYNRALGMGDQLLALTTGGDDMANVPQDQWDWVYNELKKEFSSRAMYGEPDEDTFAGRAVSAHGFAWEDRVESSALRGEQWAIALVAKATQGTNEFLSNHAKAVLAEIEAKNPAALQQFINQKAQS